MKKIIYILAIASIFYSCQKNNEIENSSLNIEGEYYGTFKRDGNITNVSLNFINGAFNGEGDELKFPAICNGTYSTLENTINFENACVWTADFDWTLILNNNWNYRFRNNILTLTEENGDEYLLTKR